MSWHFRDHRGFQRDALVATGVAGGVGALVWALPIAGTTGWMMMVIGPVLAFLVGQAGQNRPRRHLITVATSALGAVLAGATWRALAAAAGGLGAGDALLVGLLSGLAASSALVIANIERVAEPPLARALDAARAALGGPFVDERALADRAAVAHDRI